MKKIQLIIILLLLHLLSMAQQGIVLKSYAYTQQFISGVQMEGQDEVKPLTTYFIYLEIPKKNNIEIKYIWIGRQCSKTQTIAVTTLPVIVQNNSGMDAKTGAQELVPKTKNTVLQVMLNGDADDKKLTTGKKLAAKNTYVVAYVYKAKWCYFTGKTIKPLEKQFGM